MKFCKAASHFFFLSLLVLLAVTGCKTHNSSSEAGLEAASGPNGAVFNNVNCNNSESAPTSSALTSIKLKQVLPLAGDTIEYSGNGADAKRLFPWIANIKVIKSTQNEGTYAGDSTIIGCLANRPCDLVKGNVELQVRVAVDHPTRNLKVDLVSVIPNQNFLSPGGPRENINDMCKSEYTKKN